MWKYEKKLQYPVNIKNPNPKYAQIIITQYGGPDGEASAALRYLTQRYGQPYNEVKATLTDIGTEELAHMEMICAMVHQLTRNLTPEEINASGFAPYFVDHTNGVYQIAASGMPWTATYYQSKGDVITDLHEDLAAEQKARVTYDNLLRLIDDPDITEPLKFLREREIVHYQRFGEALRITERYSFSHTVHFSPIIVLSLIFAFQECPSEHFHHTLFIDLLDTCVGSREFFS